MAGNRRTIGIVALAALAILAGTAATVFSGRSARSAAPATEPAVPRGSSPSAIGPQMRRLAEPSRSASVGVLVLRHPERTPVAGARVLLHTGRGRIERTTDADGRAAFADALSGRVRLDTSAEGMATDGRTTALEPGENPTIEVLLFESAVIEGRVLALGDGAPVAGARVTALARSAAVGFRLAEGGGVVPMGPVATNGPEAVTDATGAFRLRDGRPDEALVLEARADGFAAECVTVYVPPADAGPPASTEIRLSRVGRVRGTIRDTRGRAIEGAAVSAVPSAGGGAPPSPLFRRSPGENSAADGTYVVEGLAVGVNYSVQSWGGAGADPRYGRAPLSRPVVVWLPPETGEAVVDLVLPLRGTLLVDWADPSGRADGGARCLAFPLDASTVPIQAVTNRQGGPGMRLELAEGRYRVVVDSDHHGIGEAEAVVVGEGETRVRVTVGTGPALEGSVVDEEGRPIPGVYVRAMRAGDEPGAETPDPYWTIATNAPEGGNRIIAARILPTGTTADADALPGASLRSLTDAVGRFRVDGMRPGTRWHLYASASELTVEPAGPFEVPTRDIRLVARRYGALRGRLFLPAGAAVPSTRSIHFECDAPRTPAEQTLRTTSAFGDGSFLLEGLRPGKGRLWARTETAFLEPIEVVVPSADVADLGTLAMEGTHVLVGQVVLARGGPLGRVVVECSLAERRFTDDQRMFSITGLPRGEVTLRIHCPPPYDSSYRKVRVAIPREDASGGPLEIRIGLPGIVSGTVKDAAGRPLAGWSIRTRLASEPESTPAFAALVSPRGDYEVRLGEGAWILSLHAPGSTEATDEFTVTLSDDGRSTVNFTVRKHGSTIESK